MEVPFWEETYKDDTVFTFGNQPNQSITAIENLLDKSGRVLDVGCGDGKNSLYLAKQGFRNIEAFDLSVNAIEKLRRLAVAHSLEINAWTDNLCSFSFEKEYSLIMSFGTLHFVSKNDWHNFIMKSKKATAVGGFHIMQLFTNQLPPSPDIAPFAIGMADDGEIRKLYEDWEIIDFRSYVFEDEHPNVPRHLHASNKITARRIK